MSNDKRPEIRFPGFADDWEELKFSEVLKVNSGRDYKHLEEGDIPVYGTGGYMLSVNDKLSDIDGIGIGRKGTINKPQYLKAPYWTVDTLFYITAKKGYNLNYLYSMVQRINWKRMDESTGVPSLSKNVIEKVHKEFPSYDEQAKIGFFFKQLDDTIALHQRKLDLLKETKKGFLQKMFPKDGASVPEIRFPGFTEDWEERKLGETKTYFTDGNYGESYPSSKDMSDKENGVPFLRGSDFSNGYLDSSNANYIKYEKHQELTSGHIKQDDIVIAVRGSLGTLGYANKENEGWNINSQLAILRTNKSEILGMFLIQYLLSNKGQKEILSRNTGTALKQLPIKQLKDIPIPMPAISEQQKIGTFFKQLDDTIALQQRKLDLLKETKKGFLQKMFV
ncbi:restriction endonuclease subunit S [Enterococcus hirae]|uniref:restriction endonuclease subunit S n=1 Tax=Enterococcus hirae TaxID=1354 RepID=UPI000BBCA3AD|nr:restriction endonuclease subunit S [Enterococcus hirae]EMF0287477.1 restriction endonuclease subunit S [Enterococcus hirae]PCE01621.1 type I restriction endonuclease subunit S [Enterococcus hirae]